MKSQDWAAAALCLLSFVFLLASYSIAYAKGPKDGPSLDIGTIHNIGTLNNALPRVGSSGGIGLQPPVGNVTPMAPALLAVPRGQLSPSVRTVDLDVDPAKSVTKTDKDMQAGGPASSSAAKRVAIAGNGEVEARQQEAAADTAPKTNAVAKPVAIIPTCN